MTILLLAAAKLPFIHFLRLSPLLWPLNLYFPLARHLPRLCNFVISTSSALFVFRLRQILYEQPRGDPRGRTRWERALLLVNRELLHARTSAADEANLQNMLMSISM